LALGFVAGMALGLAFDFATGFALALADCLAFGFAGCFNSPLACLAAASRSSSNASRRHCW
jgi:hypothetical protein